jgi:hypothetical protein
MQTKNLLVEIVGWYGMAAILSAYTLINFHVLETDALIYILLNLTGSLGIVVNAYSKKSYPPAALNLVWMLIAIFGLVQLILA